MTETALTRSSDGFDRPWTYTSPSLRRHVPYGAAILFTCTGLLGLPFALLGTVMGAMMVMEGSLLLGTTLLAMIGWGLILLARNVAYLVRGRSYSTPIHWLSTSAYHLALGLCSGVVGFGGVYGALVFTVPYLLMGWLAARSYATDKRAMLREAEVAHVGLLDLRGGDALVSA